MPQQIKLNQETTNVVFNEDETRWSISCWLSGLWRVVSCSSGSFVRLATAPQISGVTLPSISNDDPFSKRQPCTESGSFVNKPEGIPYLHGYYPSHDEHPVL